MKAQIFVPLLFTLVFSHLFASESYSKTLSVVHTEWFPYSYRSEGKSSGLSIEIYTEALKRAGYTPVYTQRPWARALREFKAGKYDLLVDGSNSTFPNCAQPAPITWVINYWVHQESTHTEFTGHGQFDDKIVAYVRDYDYPSSFNNYKAFKLKTSVPDDTTGLILVNKGRVEAFIGDLLNNSELVKQHNFNVRPLLPAIELQMLSLCFSPKLLAERYAFEASLKSMFEEGRISEFYQQYFGYTYQELIRNFH
ncbi:MAG: transporter substrate-binding domain-containing protein [Halopseudomonas aestusnigri]